MHNDQLKHAAIKAREAAYAPYSQFNVGAAILDENNVIHQGCNVENAAYPLGCCAEQSAVSQMIINGGHRIKQILILGRPGEPCPPCGACRQIIFEHGNHDTLVHLEAGDGEFSTRLLTELLPEAFDHSQLSK